MYTVVTINLYLTGLVFKLYCMVYGKSEYYLREKDILWNERYFVENKTDCEACLKNAVNFCNMNFRDFFYMHFNIRTRVFWRLKMKERNKEREWVSEIRKGNDFLDWIIKDMRYLSSCFGLKTVVTRNEGYNFGVLLWTVSFTFCLLQMVASCSEKIVVLRNIVWVGTVMALQFHITENNDGMLWNFSPFKALVISDSPAQIVYLSLSYLFAT